MGAAGSGFWQRARRHWPWPRQDAPAPVSPAPEPTGPLGGHTVLRPLGQGTVGQLSLARAPGSGQVVALKVVALSHDTGLGRERFEREAAAAARIRHPNVVALQAWGIDTDAEPPQGWLAMEWVDGHDLTRHTRPDQGLRADQVLDLAARVAEALACAHRLSVVHRDIKPANILVSDDLCTVKVADFGCALLKDQQRSRSGVLLGSPAYMAPEQVLGRALDGPSDLYALGVLIFELLTARLPFESSSLGDLLAQVTRHEPPPLSQLRPDLPAELSALLASCLAKDPSRRPADGMQLACELRRLSPLCAPPVSQPGQSAPDGEAQCAITP